MQQLYDAGYTGLRGTLLFCAGMALLGYAMGSFVFFVLLNVILGPENHEFNFPAGAALGVLLGVVSALVKIRRGNRLAIETVEDEQWQRELGLKRRKRS